MARMQRDMAEIRAENRLLRTLGVQPVVPTPRQAAFTTTKVLWFGGTTSWEQYQQVFDKVWVATVNQPKSPPDQVADFLRRLLASMAPPVPVPAPVPEVPMVEKLVLQRLVAENQRCQPAPVIRDEPVGLEKLLRSYLSKQQTSGQQSRQRPARRGWNDWVCFSCGKAGHGANRCPTLDESFPSMLPGWRAQDPGWLLDDFISYGSGPSSNGKRSLIRGEGFVTRISSNIRPQYPGGGAAWLAAPREREKKDVMNLPEVSVVEPQSAPSRISVVLVEEAKVGGAHRVEYPRVDQDLRLLAGVAKPASATVREDSHLSPRVEETLSSPDLAGKLVTGY